MGNHVHLLMTPSTVAAASKMMQRVNQRYSQYRNLKYQATGKLFEQRFESEPVESDRHLAFFVLYINANPHAANMPNSHEFRWSSQALHCGGAERYTMRELITYDSWYLGLGATMSERTSEYRKVFANYLLGRSASVYAEQRFIDQALLMEPKSSVHRPTRPDGSRAQEQNAKYAENTMQDDELAP